MTMLKDIDIDSTLRDDMVDVDSFVLQVSADSRNRLCHSRVVFVLGLREQRRDEDDMVCVD